MSVAGQLVHLGRRQRPGVDAAAAGQHLLAVPGAAQRHFHGAAPQQLSLAESVRAVDEDQVAVGRRDFDLFGARVERFVQRQVDAGSQTSQRCHVVGDFVHVALEEVESVLSVSGQCDVEPATAVEHVGEDIAHHSVGPARPGHNSAVIAAARHKDSATEARPRHREGNLFGVDVAVDATFGSEIGKVVQRSPLVVELEQSSAG